MMNRYERPPGLGGEAQIRYMDADFKVVRPGAFVRCAVTGKAIALDELRYWSVQRQEAYSGPAAVQERLKGPAGDPGPS